tara:strand:+ start:1035 stop:1157 length:123 start_codon:yes stop_codon:yes gene_type:complete
MADNINLTIEETINANSVNVVTETTVVSVSDEIEELLIKT